MDQTPGTIHTVGYQGRTLAEFLALLAAHRIDELLDIRESPWSRKPGFSAKPLAAALEAAGIAYRAMPELGTPRPLRDAYRADGDLAALFAGYRAHLETRPEALAVAAERAAAGRAVLFCFEREPSECHRQVVAAALAERYGLAVVHL